MGFDALSALRASGQWVDLLSTRQRDVLGRLTEEEVEILVRVKRMLDEVAPDVQGHHEFKVL
ncbi:aroma-sacti cluster domain-containing protein [Thermoactinospora rubra]|uniref:aroma-sacti cluster domain-containing protein n=1 Tax=Thermoactinospora rubra TaxID=1088767 RepID=UPI000A10D211|nr:aroma-sacti cluster domain-containing protein [Thermoactinospora rubra]